MESDCHKENNSLVSLHKDGGREWKFMRYAWKGFGYRGAGQEE